MQVTQEQVTPCEIDLQIEIEVEKVNKAIDETYKELGKVTNVPGFRKGKAPRVVLENFLDEDKVKERAADRILQPAYKEALEETKIEPWAPADVELVKFEIGEPLVFKARVPLAPKVELGDYVGLEIERDVPEVTEEQIDDEIKRMLERQTQYDPIKDRPLKKGDTAVLELRDESKPDEEPRRQVANLGELLPEFNEGLEGMSVDEEKVIEVTYPEDYQDEELHGRTVSFKVKVVEAYDRKVPELNDEWVKKSFVPEPKEGEEPDPDAVDTVEKLRAKIREAMEKAARDIADTAVENEIVEKIVQNSTVDFPEVMVNERVHSRLDELVEELKKRQLTLDDYIKHTGKSPKELSDEYAEEARAGIKTSLVLHEILEKESLKVEDEEYDKEVEAMAESRNVPVESMKAYIDSTNARDSISHRILHKKVMDFLVHASNIKNVGQ